MDMKIKAILRNEVFYLIILTAFTFSFFLYFSIISPGCEGGMDSYNHYLISKYSWKYPKLFLDQWGKPLYNILTSPFANIGFLGVKIFNILLWLSSAWLAWATAKKLDLSNAWLGFVLVILPQVSIENVISGLTEYLNEFLLILFVFLAASKKWNMAAAICGLLPFARSEGFVIMAVVGFYLVFIEKQYKSLIWFIAGPILFNIIGWAVQGDPLWVITNNPYIKAQVKGLNLCGSGSLFHYANLSRFIFSFVGTILVVLGTIFSLIYLIKTETKKVFVHRFVFWLVAGIFWIYLAVHSLIWWKGLMGSCGYTRVMVVITPLMAILSVYAFHFLVHQYKRYSRFLFGLLASIILVSLSHSYQYVKRNFPLQISEEQKVFVDVAKWLKTTEYKKGMTYHLYAYLSVIADIDPYDSRHFTDLWSFDFNTSPIGSIIIWDGHFGPNECQIPLDKLKNDSNLVLIKSFIPNTAFTTLNNYPFEVHVFKKVKNSRNN